MGLRKAIMAIAVAMLLVGGVGSISAGAFDATAIMALALAGALVLLDLTGKPAPRSPKAVLGLGLLIIAVAAAFVMVYQRITG